MRAIDRKLLRDLGQLKGQILTVALVVAAGLGGLIGLNSTLSSIERSMYSYYDQQRFGEVFAQVVRAPATLEERIVAIPGVQNAYTRIVEPLTVPIEGMLEPATGQVVSVPANAQPPLNALHITHGRYLEPGRGDEALVLDSFARAHGLEPGDTLRVIMGGTMRDLEIVGLAMSPEFVFIPRRGEFVPDDRSVTVVWMAEEAVAAAFQMEGAFNDVVATLQPGARPDEVADALDALLGPYGAIAAFAREDHPSHTLVADEQTQLRTLGATVPVGFLAIAAFLLNVVISRLVQLQRPQIATLKALGYANLEIALHFFKFVIVILVLGSIGGTLFGAWIGGGFSGQYAEVFRFPALTFELNARIVAIGVIVSVLAGLAGAFGALYRVARLAPAEAMQPPAPPHYRRTLVERLGFDRLLSGPMRIVIRELERQPVRFGLSVLGLALGVALLVVGRFGFDAIDRIIVVQFERAWREDVSVVLVDPMPARVAGSFDALPGVEEVEVGRSVPVRFHAGPRWRDSLLIGFPADSRLRRVVDDAGAPIALPATGMLISRALAEGLGIAPGDVLRAEVRQGERRVVEIEVVGLVDDLAGLQGYMRLDAMHDVLGEAPAVTDVYLRVDPLEIEEVFRRLEAIPAVESAQRRSSIRAALEERFDEGVAFQNLVIALVAAAITVGVVYNNARVALALRGRDLASLRVLGFTRREVGFILLGEQAIQVVIAIPLGWVLGRWFAALLIASTDPESFRLPIVVSLQTYLFAAGITLAAAVVSGMLVRRRLNQFDLTEVLKSRE